MFRFLKHLAVLKVEGNNIGLNTTFVNSIQLLDTLATKDLALCQA